MADSLRLEHVSKTDKSGTFAGSLASERAIKDRKLLDQAIGEITRNFSDFGSANDNPAKGIAFDLSASASAVFTLISMYSTHLSAPLRSGIINQCKRLLEFDEDDDENLIVSTDSFQTMLRCLVEVAPKKRPNLGISDQGRFLAAWKNEESSLFVDFSSEDRVNWLSISSDGDEIERLSGKTSVRKFLSVFNDLGARELVDG